MYHLFFRCCCDEEVIARLTLQKNMAGMKNEPCKSVIVYIVGYDF